MTSWPWMKGVDVAIADPIEPVNEYDDRPSVKALIAQNREKIEKIKEGLKGDPLFEPETKHDDLWILRFWLSHKKTKKAIEAATHTLKYRKEYKLDEQDIRGKPPHRLTKEDAKTSVIANAAVEYLARCKPDAYVFVHVEDKRGVIGFFQFDSVDSQKLVDELPEDVWVPAFTCSNEYTFQWLDYETRRTGRLTKTIRLVDLSKTTFSSIHRECSRRDGKAMDYMEDCYPQLLETLFICNPPTWIHIAWKIIRPIMPKRVVSKMDFISPANNEKERKRLYRHISQEKLPVKFGGRNTTLPVDM